MSRGDEELLIEASDIKDDRDLLEALDLSDSQAASYLGKSRQALNNGLQSKRHGVAPNDYFKISELPILVIAARSQGVDFDEEHVRGYLTETWPLRGDADGRSLALVMQILDGVKLDPDVEVDVRDASIVVMILPDFLELRYEREDAAERLRDVASAAMESNRAPHIVILSSSSLKARAAASWLGLSGERVHPIAHEFADHYVPMVLVYNRSEDNRDGDGHDPQPFILTDADTLVAAPQYRAPMMAECVRLMLPEPVRAQLFPPEAPVKRIPARSGKRRPAGR